MRIYGERGGSLLDTAKQCLAVFGCNRDDIKRADSTQALECTEASQRPYPYAALTRAEVLPFIPDGAQKILDVGCGAGGFGATLRRSEQRRVVWGIEANADAAAQAATYYDAVLVGMYPAVLEGLEETFDCIVTNDILEHLVDPWKALEVAAAHLCEGGVLVASIPNVRYLPVVLGLVLKGRWEYADTGVLDRTHLRFFTKESMATLFHQSGYVVDSITGINRIRGARWAPSRLLPGSLRDMRCMQFVVVARPVRAAFSGQ